MIAFPSVKFIFYKHSATAWSSQGINGSLFYKFVHVNKIKETADTANPQMFLCTVFAAKFCVLCTSVCFFLFFLKQIPSLSVASFLKTHMLSLTEDKHVQPSIHSLHHFIQPKLMQDLHPHSKYTLFSFVVVPLVLSFGFYFFSFFQIQLTEQVLFN